MEIRYQRAKHDGHLDWSVGSSAFSREWEPVYDVLRFHRGKQFRLQERPGEPGPKSYRLNELDGVVHERLDREAPKTILDIQSIADNFSISMRRVEIEMGGERVIDHAASRKGIPYVFGVTDCSWLSEASYAPEINMDWPHNAEAQHDLFRSQSGYELITRAQIRPGDLLWHHNDDHVSVFIDHSDGGRVWDTEPHGVQGPSGWGYIPAGVQIRPMTGNYYCNWTDVCGIGRVVSVNGAP